MQETTKEVVKKQKEKFENYQAVFTGPVGREVLWDLMEIGHIVNPVFSTDPIEMAFNEGKRNLVLQILKYTNVDLKKIDEMIKEENRYVRE